MNIVNCSGGLRSRLTFALAIIVSGCIQIVALIEPNSRAIALADGKQSASSTNDRRANQKNQQTDDKNSTRPRRVEAQTEVVKYSSAGGPIIRVALMTDVSAVALSSSSILAVRRASSEANESKKIVGGSLTIELRKHSGASPVLQPIVATYRVSVGSLNDSRGARKVLDELKKKFFEPAAMSFDERQKEYSVLIGQFVNRSEAAQFLERLRRSGYESLRIVTEKKTPDVSDSDPQTDTNARNAKYKAQPVSTAHPTNKPDRSSVQMIALAADKVAASSEDELVISPVAGPGRLDANYQPSPASGNIQSSAHVPRRNQSDFPESGPEASSAPASVRIGVRNYRGEIRLVLNSAGRINVVNALPLEEYLRGVVPMELSPGAYPEIEALKAQAVAARSYALNHLGQHRDQGYDLVDDTRAQVYGGLSAERELTNRAIDETRGIAAVVPNEDGKLTPIEALYTANCGGGTENNEEVFGGKPLPYLRAVACSPDQQTLTGQDIVSSRTREPLVGIDGRSIAREVALLSVLGFSIPRRPTNGYLSHTPDADEVSSWMEQTALLTQRNKPKFTRNEGVRLAEFARLVALSAYGEGRAGALLAPADVDYLLGGFRVQGVPRETRAEVAMLLRDGILRLPADGTLDGHALITRGQAIETVAHVVSARAQSINLKSQISDPKSQSSDSKSQSSDPKSQSSDPKSQSSDSKSQSSDSKSQSSGPKSQVSDASYSRSQISTLKSEILKSEIAAPSANGRLIIAEQRSTARLGARDKGTRFTSLNTSGSGRLTRQQQDEAGKDRSGAVVTDVATNGATTVMAATRQGSQRFDGQALSGQSARNIQPAGLEISEGAWLFRNLGGEIHQVDRLTIIGGERISYHLSAKGQVDFLEASLSDRSASSDRFSSVAQWQERIPIEEMQQRLARAHVDVGRIEKIEPVAFSSSSRVTEVEVTGDERTARLRRPQIRAALGLKEYLFVVDRETDERGQVVAFIFTGRGWGHGVGMCQTGAYGLAKNGYSYAAILQKYYTGVNLHKMY